MANPFTQKNSSDLNNYEQKYNVSRGNLLLVVVFTAINLLLLVTNSDSYFLFSAFIPYFITTIGMIFCGRFPEEYYSDGMEDLIFLDNSFFVILLVISVLLTLTYLLAWFMSGKNRVGWLIFALAFFVVDTVAMLFLNGIALETIMDILFHAWVIYYLISGISAHFKLKKLPTEEKAVSSEDNPVQNTETDELSSESDTENSPIIREAEKDVKHRILLEATVQNFDICYRRVKHTNELVVNGNVYDELEGIIETTHTLKAFIDGHYIEAGFNGVHSFISVDGENAAKKVRLF